MLHTSIKSEGLGDPKAPSVLGPSFRGDDRQFGVHWVQFDEWDLLDGPFTADQLLEPGSNCSKKLTTVRVK
jgi:hypothetical protein